MSRILGWLLIATLASIVACSDDSGSDGGDGGKGNPPKPKPEPPIDKPIKSDPVIDRSEFPNKANTIFGIWTASETEFGNGMAYFTYLYFNENSIMAIEQHCWVPGERIGVEMLVPANITRTKVIVSSHLQKEGSGQKVSRCAIQVDPEVISYEVKGNALRLKRASGTTESYSRMN